eukprot:6299992-Amphidinium_carterae.1
MEQQSDSTRKDLIAIEDFDQPQTFVSVVLTAAFCSPSSPRLGIKPCSSSHSESSMSSSPHEESPHRTPECHDAKLS